MKIRSVLSMLVICLISFMSVHFLYAQEEKTIVAEGVAAGNSLTSYDEALNRALRNAIEQGVGAVIDSATMVKNFQLLDDKVYSGVKGYVKSYEIISDNKGEGGIYRIKVNAVVALGRLRSDIEGLGLLMEKKSRPRVMIIFIDSVDGLEQPGEVTQIQMEKAFLDNGFKLVDKSQLEMVKARDVTLSFENPDKAAALGRRYGAEVVIVGQGTSDLVDTSKPYGVSVFAYQAQSSARAIKVDTAAVLASESINSIQRGGGRVPTAKKALEDAGIQLANKVMDGVVEAWRSDVYNTVVVQLIIENATANKALQLENELKKQRSIKSVSERSLTKGVLELEVEIMGNTSQLAGIIDEMQDVKLQVIDKTENRLDLRFLE